MSIKRPRWIVWVLLLLWLIPQHNGIQAQDTPLSIAEQVNNLTLEQKVAQMMIVSIFGPAVNEPAAAMIRTWQPGAIVLLPSNLENPAQITRLTNEIQTITLENGTIPAFITVDQEGGIIARLDEGFTDWPVPSLLTATGNTDLAYAFGQALATELRAVGINMNLAPVADLQSEIDNPVIGRRAFGDDPVQVSPIVASVIAGMQDTNVLATAKHFPGHGATTVDSHLELPVLPFTAEELFNRELLPFTTAIENASVGAIMMSHIHFPTFDPDEALPS
ncbi:MAG: glycoside hydrolase family 3 N-terminal domain-containing protein [Chloroflexota bacterium]